MHLSTTRKALFTLATLGLAAFAAHPASAQSVITGLFDTGVDAVGVSQANGTIGDLHYTLVSVPTGSTTQTVVRTSAGGYPIPPYIGDSPTSAFIGPNNSVPGASFEDLAGPAGIYDYQTTFTVTGLATGFTGSTVITGNWAVDNLGQDILINGVSTGNTDTAGFATYTPFTISATGLKNGTNTIDFLVNNLYRTQGDPNDNPTALRVDGITASPLNASAAPEPSQMGVLLLIVASLGGLAVKARKRTTAAQTA